MINKKQIQQEINNRFYSFIESNFPEYEMYDEMGGRVILMENGKADNSIEYHQSRHELSSLNWTNAKTKSDLGKMEMYLNINIIPNVSRLNKDLSI